MTEWAALVENAQGFDGVALSASYGEPSLKVGKALLTRYRVADDSIVIKNVDPDERDMLMERAPDIFFLEDHYESYDIVLARLAGTALEDLMPFLERSWRMLATKKDLAAYDERQRGR